MPNLAPNTGSADLVSPASAEKRSFFARVLGRMAHEVRNPLSSLLVHVQLLEEDLRRQEPLERDGALNRLAIIHAELHRLDTLVTHLLKLSRPAEAQLRALAVRPLVDRVCQLLEPEASRRNIVIESRAEAVLPTVLADESQLSQALLNLVINALQAIGHNGRVLLSISTSPGGGVDVGVTDSGPGVPADKRTVIFEPFFTTHEEGSGLGLWIVQQIVAAHEGEVSVEDAPDGGAVFTVHLPPQHRDQQHG